MSFPKRNFLDSTFRLALACGLTGCAEPSEEIVAVVGEVEIGAGQGRRIRRRPG